MHIIMTNTFSFLFEVNKQSHISLKLKLLLYAYWTSAGLIRLHVSHAKGDNSTEQWSPTVKGLDSDWRETSALRPWSLPDYLSRLMIISA